MEDKSTMLEELTIFFKKTGSPTIIYLASFILLCIALYGIFYGGLWLTALFLSVLGLSFALMSSLFSKRNVEEDEKLSVILPEPLTIPEVGPEKPEEEKESEETESNSFEERTFIWNFALPWRGESFSFQINVIVDLKTLQEYRDKPRETDWNKALVEYPRAATKEVFQIAYQLRQYSADIRYHFFPIEEVCNAATMIQQAIPYSYDFETAPNHVKEYWRYPIETIYDATGDCECKSILFASLLLAMGYKVALLLFSDHMALGIALPVEIPNGYFYEINGEKYYYYETTAENWFLGEIPEKYKVEIPIYRVITPGYLIRSQ